MHDVPDDALASIRLVRDISYKNIAGNFRENDGNQGFAIFHIKLK